MHFVKNTRSFSSVNVRSARPRSSVAVRSNGKDQGRFQFQDGNKTFVQGLFEPIADRQPVNPDPELINEGVLLFIMC